MTNHKKSVHRSGGEDSFCETSDGLFISSWVMQLPSSIMWFALRVRHSLLRRARHKEGLQKVKTERGAGFPRNVPSDLSPPISILAGGFLEQGNFSFYLEVTESSAQGCPFTESGPGKNRPQKNYFHGPSRAHVTRVEAYAGFFSLLSSKFLKSYDLKLCKYTRKAKHFFSLLNV